MYLEVNMSKISKIYEIGATHYAYVNDYEPKTKKPVSTINKEDQEVPF